MSGHVASPLTQRQHAPALALARPVPHGVNRRTPSRADRRREGGQWPRELGEGVAPTVAEAPTRNERAPALGGAVEASGQHPPDARRRLLGDRRTVERLRGLGKRGCPGLLTVAQLPDHAATDHGGPIDLVGETATGRCLGQHIGGEGQPTPGEPRDRPLGAQRTDEAREGHGRERAEHRPPLPTPSSMPRPQGVAGHVWPHRARASDAGQADREHGFAHGTRDAPEGETPQPDTDVRRVAGETPTPATGRRGCALNAQGQEQGQDDLDTGLAIVKQATGRGCILESNGDRAVVPGLCGGWAPCVTPRGSSRVS
jgi:hypothetical protein